MTYPDNCIRGISNKGFLIEFAGIMHPTASIFQFKKEDEKGGWIEQSINWEDDESVIQFTLAQTKDNRKLQFEAAAIIPRSEIDRLNRRYNNNDVLKDVLRYERQALEHNRYHGNILLKANIPKRIKQLIVAGLLRAIDPSKIIIQN